MRMLILGAAMAVFASGPGVALANPDDPNEPQQSGCISTYCKSVYDPGDLPPDFEPPTVPDGDICMQLVLDESRPPEEQWDGCVLP